MTAKNELRQLGMAEADSIRECQKEKQLKQQSLTRTKIKDV
jgi:hypothetical protein